MWFLVIRMLISRVGVILLASKVSVPDDDDNIEDLLCREGSSPELISFEKYVKLLPACR